MAAGSGQRYEGALGRRADRVVGELCERRSQDGHEGRRRRIGNGNAKPPPAGGDYAKEIDCQAGHSEGRYPGGLAHLKGEGIIC